jgi:hypothetical protein
VGVGPHIAIEHKLRPFIRANAGLDSITIIREGHRDVKRNARKKADFSRFFAVEILGRAILRAF